MLAVLIGKLHLHRDKFRRCEQHSICDVMGCVLVANNGVTEHVTCPLWGHARDDDASQRKKMAV